GEKAERIRAEHAQYDRARPEEGNPVVPTARDEPPQEQEKAGPRSDTEAGGEPQEELVQREGVIGGLAFVGQEQPGVGAPGRALFGRGRVGGASSGGPTWTQMMRVGLRRNSRPRHRAGGVQHTSSNSWARASS